MPPVRVESSDPLPTWSWGSPLLGLTRGRASCPERTRSLRQQPDRYPAPVTDLGALRIPLVPASKGLYESLYLTATDANGKRALWLRHTWLKHPGKEPEPTLWVTWWGP